MVNIEYNKRPTINEIVRDYFRSKISYLEITEEAQHLNNREVLTSSGNVVKKKDISLSDINNIDDTSYVWPTPSINFFNYSIALSP